jgi:hypothetical protein
MDIQTERQAERDRRTDRSTETCCVLYVCLNKEHATCTTIRTQGEVYSRCQKRNKNCHEKLRFKEFLKLLL